MQVLGVTDISSSEGKLHRFTQICMLIKSARKLSKPKLYVLMAEKDIGIRNRHVIERHLMLLEKLGMIERLASHYVLRAQGRVLTELAKGGISSENLSLGEKILYFRALFASVLRQQLVELLEIVQANQSSPRKEIVQQYFDTQVARKLWNVSVIDRNLSKLRETGKVPSFFANKFGCMEMWLKDLGLLETGNHTIALAPAVPNAVEMLRDDEASKSHIYELAGAIHVGRVTGFDSKRDFDELVRLLKGSSKIFALETGVTDFEASKTHVCISLLMRGRVLESSEFDEMIRILVAKRIVRSVMLGRDGKPAYITLV